MKHLYAFILLSLLSIFSLANTLGFEKNIGQIVNQNNKQNTSVLYTLKLDGFNVNLNKVGFNYDFYENENNVLKTHRIEFRFKNINPNYKIIRNNRIDYFENYIHQNKDFVINFYQKIIYKNFYQNIDLEFYVNPDSNKPFEYNFILHPGSKINDIQFDIKGAKEKLKANQLDIKLRFGDLVESLPNSWIEHNNKSENINVEYCYHQNGNIGLQTNQNIINKKVVIDPLPIRKWGSYLSKYYFNGYPTDNHFMSIDRVKFHGNEFYIFGTTSQRNLATTGAFQTIALNNTYQPFIAKFNTKSERIWFTYFGSGGNTEYAKEMDIDNDGNIYVGFDAFGNGLATPGAYQVNKDEYYDILIAKFNTNGVRQWSTYYGGNLNEGINALKVDPIDKTLYIAGSSHSSNLVHSSNAIIKTQEFNEGKGLIVKFDLNGNYIWSSLSYGSIDGLTIDNEHNIIITENRSTSSSNSLAYDKELSKYDKNLTPIWIQKKIGQIYTPIEKIITDNNNDIIIVGATIDRNSVSFGNSYSPTFTSSSVYESTSLAGFLKKFSSDGTQIFGTFIGEKGKSYISDIVIGHNNEIIIVGDATDESKVSYGSNHFQTNIENRSLDITNDNALLMKFDSAGNPIWGFLSGDKAYLNRYVGVDFNYNTNEIIAVGWNASPYMISTPNGYQTKPIYEHQYGKLTGYNGTLTLYEDNKPNNFKIDKSGDDCYLDSLTYTASGANNYIWYDYDGNIVSTSSILSPSIPGQYTCKFDDGTNIGYISIIAQEVNLNLPPTPVVNNLPKITNYCIVKLDKPKAITSCGVEIEASTDKVEYNTPGTHQVLWTYVDKFGNKSEQTQEVEVLAAENFLNVEQNITVCESDNYEIYNLTSIEQNFNITENVNFNYYESLDKLENNLPINSPETYQNIQSLEYVYIKATLNSGCSAFTKIHLKTKPKPIANRLVKNLCDVNSTGIVEINLNQFNTEINNEQSTTITYYRDSNYTNKVETTSISNNELIYVKVENGLCVNYSTILFKLSNYTVVNSTPFETCKNENTVGQFNLSEKTLEIATSLNVSSTEIIYFETLEEAKNNSNPITGVYNNRHNLDKIYATYISTDKCKTYVEIPLVENINPIINLQDIYYKCKNTELEVQLDANYDNVLWSTGESSNSINILNSGKYSVTVTTNNCHVTKTFEIKDFNELKVDYKYDGKQVHFTILNDFNAKMSLDGVNYTSNFSFILEQGEYTFYFKSENGCIETRQIYLYKDLPSIMTPNGDGINDVWNLSYLKELKYVRVFNRLGRIVFEATASQQPIEWNGKYQLKSLPSDTYWYIIELNNGEKINGSLLIKNK